jgi:hypothetical protein
MVWVPLASAKDSVCRGQWDGEAIEIRLKLNERTNLVTGQVYKPGSPSDVMATLSGRRLADGSMEVQLTYRFEDYGTYRLMVSRDGSTKIWQTSAKDLWFGLSD